MMGQFKMFYFDCPNLDIDVYYEWFTCPCLAPFYPLVAPDNWQ
jgi:hypothetical protein